MTEKPTVLIPSQKAPQNYVSAIKSVGLNCDLRFSTKDLSAYSGLLLTGGGDVLSNFYNGSCSCRKINVIRDVTEFKLLDYFLTNGIPVLGVCRGMQIINVFLGGSLKNVPHHQSENGEDVYHSIFSESSVFNTLDKVNSNHRQCVDKLCPNARDLLFASDGIIEGFALDNVIAVQFHPERMSPEAIKAVYGEFSKLVYSYFERSL